jgi:hypothetical protein
MASMRLALFHCLANVICVFGSRRDINETFDFVLIMVLLNE